MPSSHWIPCVVALFLGLAVTACDDSSMSPDDAATLSGTVVYSQTGDPAAGVDVDLQRCEQRMGTMMDEEWHPCDATQTAVDGRFHFEYMHQSMHRYRVTVRGTTDPQGVCYLDDASGQPIVLRVP
ncbi:MAG TPA: hypothetical protein VFT13_13780 [Candidatus Krumholzibacteria bacterium]|nr:hypothetical protein [Candidatus Krumholzibacteria bacterium]